MEAARLHDLGGVGDGDGAEDHIHILCHGLVQIGGEVGGVGGEGVLDDLAVKGLLEEGDQALVVLVAQLAQAVGLLCAENLSFAKFTSTWALEVVQEADPEVIVVACGDIGVGAGDADGGQARLVKHRAAGHSHAGAVGTQHQADILAHQLRRGGGRLVGSRSRCPRRPAPRCRWCHRCPPWGSPYWHTACPASPACRRDRSRRWRARTHRCGPHSPPGCCRSRRSDVSPLPPQAARLRAMTIARCQCKNSLHASFPPING